MQRLPKHFYLSSAKGLCLAAGGIYNTIHFNSLKLKVKVFMLQVEVLLIVLFIFFLLLVKIHAEEIVSVNKWFLWVQVIAGGVHLLAILPDDPEHQPHLRPDDPTLQIKYQFLRLTCF